MNTPKIIVRQARREDAAMIARVVAMAIGDETALWSYCGEDYLAVLTEVARREGTQYSWRYALVAEVDGVLAGAVVGYDGARLAELREGTFVVLREQIGRVPTVADETEAGEVYLDSVGVEPAFRGFGVGRALVAAFCERAFAEGHACVGLIVDYANPNAEKLYTSLGFERVGTKLFFGHQMWHLQKKYNRIMTPQHFIERFREAFGEAAPLPIAIWYDDTAAVTDSRVPRCMIGAIRKVCEGNVLTLTENNVQCGGGGLYTAFRPMPERVPLFVSETEHYKKSPQMVCDYIDGLDIELTNKPFLNFVRVDMLTTWDKVEAVLFFATPDVLSGLCTWAFYDSNAADAVVTPFASGCASAVTFAITENRKGGKRCFLGMFDPSARPLVPENELSFTIPMSRFKEMLETMNDSGLFQKAFSVVKKRINKIKQ